MNLRKLILPILSLSLIILSCGDDDEEDFTSVEVRDSQEVLDENIIEIDTYLTTHFFNYEDFDETNPYSAANDAFTVAFDTISGVNSSKTPILDYLNAPTFPKLLTKTVTLEDIDYKLYYLVVREGLGKPVHALDQAAVLYNGTVPDGTLFDSAVSIETGQPFNLTAIGNLGGVVPGFREGIIEFNTATGFTDNLDINGQPDGTLTYNDHGIGAVFMPSGLGYFASTNSSLIPQYSPLFFTLNVISRRNTDFDLDGIPSYIEHPDGSFEGDNDDTDEDTVVDLVDNDDDGDGTLTINEIIQNEYEEDDAGMAFMSKTDAQAYFDATAAVNEIFISISHENDGTYTLNTVTLPDYNNDGIPNYLDADYDTAVE